VRYLLFVVMLPAFAADAQLSISGRVLDPAGAALATATIQAEMEGAQEPHYSVRSNASGRFELFGLEPGAYRITVTSLGFRTEVIHAKAVSADHPREELSTIMLQVGNVCSGGCDPVVPAERDIGSVKIPRRCAFYIDTREVVCNLKIGEREPIEPPHDADSNLWFSSNAAGDLYLTPRNGALVALTQPCESAVYSGNPIRLDDLTPGIRICMRSAERNYSELLFVRLVARAAIEVKP
jgi:hypothetical protein